MGRTHGGIVVAIMAFSFLFEIAGWAQAPTVPPDGVTNAADYSREVAPGTM